MKLDFGTAGIRGIVGSNEDQLNEIHAARIFDGYANYLLNTFKDAKTRGVVIGRDNRKMGIKFTQIACSILTSYGIKVYFNNQMIATPVISYLTRTKNAIGAINVTASHNPKEYNGIKIYNHFGCQMLPNEVEQLKKFFKDYSNYKEYLNFEFNLSNIDKNLVQKINEKDYETYIEKIKVINWAKQDLANLKIVYSSLHGTGFYVVERLFNKLQVKMFYEENEVIEDPEFSYVKNPNPESKLAFTNSIKLAEKVNADLILITDPDSDRIGVALKHNNEYVILNGNEIAILISDYLLKYKPINSKKQNYLVYSFVSTSLPAKMAKSKNIVSYMTETGFKWIGNKIEKLNDFEFFFGFEESYGSLILDDVARDKDAFQSLYALAIIASLAKKENQNLYKKLQSIYLKYGFLKAQSFSYDLNSNEELKIIQDKFKSLNLTNNLIDFSNGYEDIEPNNMLMYCYDDNLSWVSLRPSGTEPKFKIYIHIIDKDQNLAQQKFDNIFNLIKKIL